MSQGNNSSSLKLQSNFQQQLSPPNLIFKFLAKQVKAAGVVISIVTMLLPNDVVVGHFEHQTYNDQVTGIARVSMETCVLYHVSPRCIYAKHPDFKHTEVLAPKEILGRLHDIHKLFLNQTFGLNFQVKLKRYTGKP